MVTGKKIKENLAEKLRLAQEELKKTKSELIQLKAGLDDSAAIQIRALKSAKEKLRKHQNHLQKMVEDRTLALSKTNACLMKKINELNASEDQFRELVVTMPDIVYRIDTNGMFTFVNDAINKLGYNPDELTGKHFSEIIHSSEVKNISRKHVLKKIAGKKFSKAKSPKLFDERRSGGRRTAGLKVHLISKNRKRLPGKAENTANELVPVEINSAGIWQSLLNSENKICIGTVGVIRDVSDRKKKEVELARYREHLEELVDIKTRELKKAQAKLIQTEKTAALGTLTAGVAHELNNPLMGMLNFIQYCLKHTPEDDKRYSVLLDAERETRRCAGIIQKLLTFSRIERNSNAEKFQKNDLNTMMGRVLRLLAYRIETEGVVIRKQIDGDVTGISIQYDGLQQVCLNIMGNALDAVQNKKEKKIDIVMTREKDFVVIEIADNGNGIAPEILSRIYDPFFTTKQPGEGAGLGLSVSYSIMENHNGRIECDSKKGQGSRFRIWLPVAR